MKFKKGAIKPGMVIHCPKEEDARALLEYLDSLRFGRHVNLVNWVNENTCYVINTENKWVTRSDMKLYGRNHITEFSDLIEPDDSPMTAVEVLEWLGKHYRDEAYKEVFGYDYKFTELLRPEFSSFTVQEIVDKITAYEAAKKTPKPVEIEEGYFCELYEKIDLSDIAVLGYNMWGVDKNVAIKDVREKAREYASKMEKTCYAKVTYKCRVKESK